MKKFQFLFILSIFTGLFWMQVPQYEDVYVFDPEVSYELEEGGLEQYNALNLEGTTDISFDLEISSESNFTVVIQYCAFLEANPINETGMENLVYGQQEGNFTFFILFVKDTAISSKINSSVASNRYTPQNMTHFSFNSTLTNGTPRIQMNVVSHESIQFHAGLFVSYTDYVSKLKTWVWVFPAVLVLIVGVYGLLLIVKHKKKMKVHIPENSDF